MIKLSLTILLLALSGCAQYSGFTSAARTLGAEVADKEMDGAVFILCKGVTVGAWVRRFGNNEEAAKAWKVICIEQAVTTPVQPK